MDPSTINPSLADPGRFLCSFHVPRRQNLVRCRSGCSSSRIRGLKPARKSRRVPEKIGEMPLNRLASPGPVQGSTHLELSCSWLRKSERECVLLVSSVVSLSQLISSTIWPENVPLGRKYLPNISHFRDHLPGLPAP